MTTFVVGCDDTPAPSVDAGGLADVETPVDLGPSVDVGVDAGRAPYDAGPSPVCGLAPRFGALVPRGAGYTTLEPGSLAPHRLGFLVAWRESAPRLMGGDAGPLRRDAMVFAAVGTDGTVVRGRTEVYESAAANTDVTTPVVLGRADGSAAMLFNETLASPGAREFRTDLRGAAISADAVAGAVRTVAAQHGEPFAAALPDGTPWVLTSRITETLDGGLVIARPTSFRLSAGLERVPEAGVDLTGIVPLEAESVLVSPAPSGAGLVYRLGPDVRLTRFDNTGAIDLRVRTVREVGAPTLEAAAVLGDSAVMAYTDTVNGMVTVNVVVIADKGGLVLRRELERFEGSQGRVAVTHAHGGAAVVWTRGSGDNAVLRGVVVQPDGVLRGAPRELLRVPGAEGRIVARAEGRALRFAVRTRASDGVALGFGQLCLAE
ncbi:MAG: hypothetical protein JNK72_24460 [Myxococcales bacterium]|nr:hypothetical protein [Myxococcales bacterium]